MIHADQRIVAGPGNILHPETITDIRYQRKIIYGKYHIIAHLTHFFPDHTLKFRTDVIASQLLLDIIHRVAEQPERLLDVPVIVRLPAVH